MMKNYVLKENDSKLEKVFEAYPELLRRLLLNRGITDLETSEEFLNPDYLKLHDSSLMKDMDKAVKRIIEAVKKNQKIMIYSDYDADGIPGGVILHDFFKKIDYKNFENYIPDRHEEGFGLNPEAIDEFIKNGVQLLITVDCGIADAVEVLQAKNFGIDTIITDHHEQSGELPEAFAILDPKQSDCSYPEKMICGSGVAFKLVQALVTEFKKDKKIIIKEGWEKWLLDMVGIATLSDMVPLVGENRIFAHYGLKVLRVSPRVGLLKLLQKLKINQKHLCDDDIGFSISPRINAASRMGMPIDAFKLLSTSDEVLAGSLADHLDKINNERKGIVASIVKEVKKKISSRGFDKENKKVIVIGNPEWRPALLGLVANSLVDDYECPVFLWGREGGSTIKGSCRSDGKINVLEVMELAKDFFIAFGGHKMSGGFSVPHEKIHLLEEGILKAYELAVVSQEGSIDENMIDAKLILNDVNWDNYRIIEKLSPFGIGNPKPVFMFENSEIKSVKNFGKEGNHLEIGFENSAGKKIPAIGFFMTSENFDKKLEVGRKINLVASMEKSMFRGFPELRLRIVDIV